MPLSKAAAKRASFAQLSLLVLISGLPPSHAATNVVSNTSDSGPGSLRQAILDSNNSGGGDTIIFSNTLSGTITLLSGELGVTNDVTILGPGSGVLAVSGNNGSRVFRIQLGKVSISDLTVEYGAVTATGGQPGLPGAVARGAGIFVRQTASLALTHCVIISNNITGGMGGPAPTDPGTGGNGGGGLGGGIGNAGSLTMTECTVAFNTATGGQGGPAGPNGTPGIGGFGWGGGLYSVSNATLIGCAIYQNSVIAGVGAGNAAAGIGEGGGLFNDNPGTMSLSRCTIANNFATSTPGDPGGGIVHVGIGLTLQNCTVAANQASQGGGLYVSGTGTVLGSTILANQATISYPDCEGAITSNDYNLIRDSTGATISGTTTHNLLNVPANLGPLMDNGGPTLTKAPLPGSLAIDQGNSFGSSVDQRGRPRIFDFPDIPNAADGTDIGAVELIPPVLSISGSGPAVLLSWPVTDSGYTLQMKTDPTSSWSNAPGQVTVIVGQNVVSDTISAGCTLYRLNAQ